MHRTLRMTPARAALTGGLAVIVLALTACGSSSGGPAAEGEEGGDCTVRTLLVANFSGAQSVNGVGQRIGADQAVEQVNADGGINGCTLAIDYADDGSDYTKTLPVLQEALAQNDYINVTVGDYGAASTAQLLARQGILAISDHGLTDVLGPDNPLDFDVAVVPDQTDPAVIAPTLLADGHEKIAMLADNTASGTTVLAAMTEKVEELGMEVVATEQVGFDVVSMVPAVQRLQASGADALYFQLYGAQAGYLIRDLKASGWDAAPYGGQYVGATDMASLVPAADIADLKVAIPAFATLPGRPVMDDFLTALREEGKDPSDALVSVVLGHDVVTVLAWAANETGSTDAQTIADFLAQNGDTPVPGLLASENTGWSEDSRTLLGADAVALAPAGAWDADGRLDGRIDLFTASE
jgi:branched-chain amino acid transport system substrate-binding protein